MNQGRPNDLYPTTGFPSVGPKQEGFLGFLHKLLVWSTDNLTTNLGRDFT